MRHLPNSRDRWLALGLLLALLALAYLLLIHPWFTAPLMAINQDIQALQERGQRVAAQLEQGPEVAQRLQQVQEELRTRPGLLTAATEESAAATLGVRLQEAVAEASPGNRACVVSNRTPLPGNRGDGEFARVALQVRLRCGVAEMAQVLHGLETGAPRLFVENLNVLAQRYQASAQETGTGLDVSFELVGYLQPMLQGAVSEPTPPAATDMLGAPGAAAVGSTVEEADVAAPDVVEDAAEVVDVPLEETGDAP